MTLAAADGRNIVDPAFAAGGVTAATLADSASTPTGDAAHRLNDHVRGAVAARAASVVFARPPASTARRRSPATGTARQSAPSTSRRSPAPTPRWPRSTPRCRTVNGSRADAGCHPEPLRVDDREPADERARTSRPRAAASRTPTSPPRPPPCRARRSCSRPARRWSRRPTSCRSRCSQLLR